MTTWGFLAVIVLSGLLVKGEYGDKVKSNRTFTSASSESFSSSEEYYDDSLEEKPTATPERPLTTLDDGVIIEKAILAAEITPKASYSLVDNPIRYDDSLGNTYTQAKFGDNKEFFGFSSPDTTASNEEENVLRSTKYSGSNQGIADIIFKSSSSKTNAEPKQRNSQISESPQPTWSFLGMYQTPSLITQKPFSSSYRSVSNSDTTSAKSVEIQDNGSELSDDGSYDPVANGDFLHLGYQSPSQQWNIYNIPSSSEIVAKLEQERQLQIQATQSYLKQVEAAQEYAAKVQALQDALYSSFQASQINVPSWSDSTLQEFHEASTTPASPQTPKSKTVPKTDAPGIINYGLQSSYQDHSSYSSPSHATHSTASQVNALAGGEWMFPVVLAGSAAGFSVYTGPTANPVVLPSGFLADTEEVTQARIAHLQALMNAIGSTTILKSQRSDRWS